MKNTGKKILILGLVITIAVAGILVFYPTIVAPPTEVLFNNLHKTSLEGNISGFTETRSTSFNDSIYNMVVDKLMLYKNEAFMTEEEIDSQTISLIQKYVPIFINLSNAKFRASVWTEKDHKEMLERISHLRSLRVKNGAQSAITSSYNEDLKKIEKVIENYKKARAVARYNTFVDIEDANKKISLAAEYQSMNPLSNCVELKNKLSEVKTKIGNSHYNMVENKVNELSGYQDMTEEKFRVLMQEVNNEIRKYKNNIINYGSRAREMSDLESKVNTFYINAINFYTSIPQLDYDTNGQWEQIENDGSYRTFKSFSNYGKDNSTATMFFTIKGYETFTFQIGSMAEKEYDYVLVGIDEKPTIDRNYANTKYDGNKGNYKYVTLNSLDKTKETKIYVVYRKDSSGSSNYDRGYLRIPLQ